MGNRKFSINFLEGEGRGWGLENFADSSGKFLDSFYVKLFCCHCTINLCFKTENIDYCVVCGNSNKIINIKVLCFQSKHKYMYFL